VHERRPAPVRLGEGVVVARGEPASEERDVGVVDGGVRGLQVASSGLGAGGGAGRVRVGRS